MMAQIVKFVVLNMLVSKDALLLGQKNVANGIFYSPQLWQTQKHCWILLL